MQSWRVNPGEQLFTRNRVCDSRPTAALLRRARREEGDRSAMTPLQRSGRLRRWTLLPKAAG